MSLISKLKEKVQTVKQEAEIIAKEMKVEPEIRESRWNICNNCDELFKLTNNCKQCGCFMTAKTWLKSAKCPLGKW
jgi:hypothetical protein